MTLFETIKMQLKTAIKTRDAATRNTLKTLVGELETRAKRDGQLPADDIVVKLIGKFIEGNNEVLAHRERPELRAENVLLESFLPTMMSESELRQAIDASGANDIGGKMAYLKANYSGRFDGKLASQIARGA